MTWPSKIDRLDPAIRAAIRERREGGATLDEILAALPALGVPDGTITRSGLHRYLQRMERLSALQARSAAIAEALSVPLDRPQTGGSARLTIELMQLVLRDMMLDAADPEAGEAAIDRAEVHAIALSLERVTRAAKAEAQLAAMLRSAAEAGKEAKEKTDPKVRVINAETLRRIREEIYGWTE